MGKYLRLYATHGNGDRIDFYGVSYMIRGLSQFFADWAQFDWVPTFDFEIMHMDDPDPDVFVKGRFIRIGNNGGAGDGAVAVAASQVV